MCAAIYSAFPKRKEKTVMKKLLAILFAAIICFGLAAPAFADAGGPMIRSVDCTVTKPDGATFYYFNYDENDENELLTKTIPYKTVVTVTAEYDPSWLVSQNNIFEGKKIGGVYYKGEYGYIDLSEVTIADGEFSLNDAQKMSHPVTYTVTDKNGLVMYSGPSQVFDVVQTIPDGAQIKLTHKDIGEEGNNADSFFYTEYNGKGGWIFKYSDTMAFFLLRKLDKYSEYTGKIKVVGKGFRLVDIFKEKKDAEGYYDGYAEIGGVIPVGTELTFDSYYDMGDYAPVEYNGVKGYVDINPSPNDAPTVITYINDSIMTLDDCDVYSAFDDFASKTGETVPEYTVLPVKAFSRYSVDDGDKWENYEWFLVEYEGKEVWLCDDDIPLFWRNSDYGSYYKIKGASAELLKTAEPDSGAACTVSKEDVLKVFAYKYHEDTDISMQYVEVVGSDKAGWINEENTRYLNGYSEPVEEEEAPPESAEETEAVDIKSGESNEAAGALDAANPASAIEKVANSSNRMIIICVAAAAIIALTAGVSIALIKKKKGDK